MVWGLWQVPRKQTDMIALHQVAVVCADRSWSRESRFVAMGELLMTCEKRHAGNQQRADPH